MDKVRFGVVCALLCAAACLSVLCLVGCGGWGDEPGADAGDLQPLTAADLAPKLQTVGVSGATPRAIAIDLAEPIVESATRDLPEGSRLRLTPTVEGRLVLVGPRRLEFHPRRPFEPSTRYAVAIEAVGTRSGVVTAPDPNPWILEFETPEFRFLRASPTRVDYGERVVELDLVFSGPVAAASVREFARILVSGPGLAPSSLRAVRFESAAEPNVVRARIASPLILPGRALEFALGGGLPMVGDPERRASDATSTVNLSRGEPARIVDVYVSESANGFILEVVCDDDAVEGKRFYWARDRGEGYRDISPRCQITDEDAAGAIHFDPEVRHTVSASGGGFRIFGEFDRGRYSLRIDSGARTIDGGVFLADYETSFEIPTRSPQLAFLSKGRYLPRAAWSSLGVRHLNVDEIELTVLHVPERNLVFWLSEEGGDAVGPRTGEVIARETIPVRGDVDEFATTFLDMREYLAESTRGAIELRIASGDVRDSSRIVLTDMQLVAKRSGVSEERPGGTGVWVWPLEAESLDPLRNVKIRLLRRNGAVVGECRSQGNRGCEIEVPENPLEEEPPFAVVARRGKDLSFIRFQDLQIPVDEARVAGRPFGERDAYTAAVYSERGVYRPGETVHVASILRDSGYEAPPAGMPVTLEIVDARGRVAERAQLETAQAGVVALDHEIDRFAPTGRWETRLFVAEQRVGSDSFHVEDFVPERMAVEVEAEGERRLLGERASFRVGARYLFGGVPQGARVEMICELRAGSFSPARHEGYEFGVSLDDGRKPRPIPLGSVTGALDGSGEAMLSCPESASATGFLGPARVVARAAVFEAGGGRTSDEEASLAVHPERFYIGLASGVGLVEVGDEVDVDGIVVDWDGALVEPAEPLTLELIRLEEEYGWSYNERHDYWTHRRYLKPIVEDERPVEVADGRFEATFRAKEGAAAFVVRARSGRARTDLRLEGGRSRWWWGAYDDSAWRTPAPDRPSWLPLELPESAREDESVTLRLEAPYSGRVLLTVETDRIIEQETREVRPGPLTWRFEVDDFVPNVYVSALLIKDPHLDSSSSYMPDRAFGTRSLRIEPRRYRQALELETPQTMRSNATLRIGLDVGPQEGPVVATVAAVDEGILSLTDFETPDPIESLFARRALGVETFETVGWSLIAPGRGEAHPGGGAAGEPGDEPRPRENVALWSGPVAIPETGRATVELEVPDYQGALRVMAVVSGQEASGSADARVVVRDPLVLQPTVPRFLVLGDRVRLPVRVTNLSRKPQKVDVRVAVSREGEGLEGDGAPLEVLGARQLRLDLAADASQTAIFELEARSASGAALLEISASSPEHATTTVRRLPLRGRSAPTTLTQRLALREGSIDLAPRLDGWLRETETTTVWVAGSERSAAFQQLRRLVRYPYGCLEQTASTTRGLLAMPGLSVATGALPDTSAPLEEMVQGGIRRMLSMQTPEGAFSYWPGGSWTSPWASAYATDVLLRARDQQYAVPKDALDRAISWIERQVDDAARRGRSADRQRAAEPLMHYVLARAGRARRARTVDLIEDSMSPLTSVAKERLYLLQAALYLAGDRRHEADLRRLDLSPIGAEREYLAFHSDLRRRGLTLSVHAELFGPTPSAERLGELVATRLRGEDAPRHTTQELVWCLDGLARLARAQAEALPQIWLEVDGRRVEPLSLRDGLGPAWRLDRASERERLRLDVEGTAEGAHVVLVSEGVRASGHPRSFSRSLRVERAYFDDEGRSIDPRAAPLRLGDIVFVRLTLTNLADKPLEYVALVDRLPAAFEVENPRLGKEDALARTLVRTAWRVGHLDIRDDRVQVFADPRSHLEPEARVDLVYTARVVSAGSFRAPPPTAEAMYEPEIEAMGSPSDLRVIGPWP